MQRREDTGLETAAHYGQQHRLTATALDNHHRATSPRMKRSMVASSKAAPVRSNKRKAAGEPAADIDQTEGLGDEMAIPKALAEDGGNQGIVEEIDTEWHAELSAGWSKCIQVTKWIQADATLTSSMLKCPMKKDNADYAKWNLNMYMTRMFCWCFF